MMRLAFRGLSPRMLGASGRRLRGGPTPFTGILPHLSGVPCPPRRDDLRISFKEHPVIRSFKDQNTRLFFEGGRVRAFRKFADQAVRRLTLLDRTDALDDLAPDPREKDHRHILHGYPYRQVYVGPSLRRLGNSGDVAEQH